MMPGYFEKSWNFIAKTLRRITGISTPVVGLQLSAPRPDTSFCRAQDEHHLMDEIWLLASSEAYIAKDGARRLQKMTGQSRLQVIEDYFAENPEIKRWVAWNIEVGTCADAISELREKKARFRQARLKQLKQRAIGQGR
jgi:hypothetical protein